MSKKKELFDTETGKFMANLALKVNLLEKKVTKRGSPKQIIDFYNEIYKICEDFEKKIINIEVSLEEKQ